MEGFFNAQPTPNMGPAKEHTPDASFGFDFETNLVHVALEKAMEKIVKGKIDTLLAKKSIKKRRRDKIKH